ncbi:MAG: hypothetical protein ACRDZ8_20370 [Acidimicrobiales bacterium]
MLVTGEVFSAHDGAGRYLVARTSGVIWLCAPISQRALDCVASGRAELRAAFSHSLTGMVERFTVRAGAVGESMIPCADLRDEDLPRAGARVAPLVRCA